MRALQQTLLLLIGAAVLVTCLLSTAAVQAASHPAMDDTTHAHSAHALANAPEGDGAAAAGAHVSSHDGMAMPMYFSTRPHSGPLLFPWSDLSTGPAYALFAVALVLACVAREYLAVYRMELEMANTEAAAIAQAAAMHAAPDASLRNLEPPRRCCGLLSSSTLASLLHAVNMALAYGIMLVVMSYDACLFALIILTAFFAHLYFARPVSPGSSASRVAASQRLTSRSPLVRMQQAQRDAEADEEARGLTSLGAGGASASSSLPFPSLMLGLSKTNTHSKSPPAVDPRRSAALHLAMGRECCES